MMATQETKYQILIVDDDASFRKILQLRLRSFLKEVALTAFGTLKETRDFLQSPPNPKFDLVILDEHISDGRGQNFLSEGWFQDTTVLSISSDDSPEIPGSLLQAGATYFLSKVSVSEPLFKPLVLGLLDRSKLQRELEAVRTQTAVLDSIKTMLSTLRHEINNPLGAVLGAAYLIRSQPNIPEQSKQAAELVESSGKRIKHVLDELCKAMELEPVTKANQKVFHIPGDERWEK